MILIVRNYKECLVRHYVSKGKQLSYKSLIGEMRGTCRVPRYKLLAKPWRLYRAPSRYSTDYVGVVNVFRSVLRQNRILIHYEDLVTNFEHEAGRVLTFLKRFEIECLSLIRFIDNFDVHRQRSLKIYEELHGAPVTRGNSIDFHSNQLTGALRLKLDTYVKRTFPELFESVLHRYAEKNEFRFRQSDR